MHDLAGRSESQLEYGSRPRLKSPRVGGGQRARLRTKVLEIVGMVAVQHRLVGRRLAESLVRLVEGLVAALKDVHLRVVQRRVDVAVAVVVT